MLDPSMSDHHWDKDHPNYDPDCTCGWDAIQAAKGQPAKTIHEKLRERYDEARTYRTGPEKNISDRQRDFLTSLLARLPESADILADQIKKALADPFTTPTKASRLIEMAKAMATPEARPNRFGGPCHKCRAFVEAEAGYLVKIDGKFSVEHRECPEQAPVDLAGLDLTNLPAGRYAIPGGDTRLKVEVRKPEKGNWIGYIFVSDAAVYGQGKRYGRQAPGGRYQGDIQKELEIILSDPMAAMAEYGHITSTCGRCFRPLEDEESVRLGIGPICRTKF